MIIDRHKAIVAILFCLAAIGFVGRLDCKTEAENVKYKAEVAAPVELKSDIIAEVAAEDENVSESEVELEVEILPWEPISEFEKAPVELETKAYTSYKVIGKNSNSAQSKYIYNHLTICDDGYLRDKDGFIAAALGSYFGGYHADSIGTRWVFVCKDGTEIPIVKVDVKQNEHTLDAARQIGSISGRYDKNGNPVRTGEYIEFYVDIDKIDVEYTNSNPCINTTPGMDGVIVGWYQVASEDEEELKSEIQLSDNDRRIAECIVAGEVGGEPYDAMVAVAQCLYDAMLKENWTIEKVRVNYQYAGWKNIKTLEKESKTAADNVCKAVSQVFDNGDFITDEQILYFYAPAYGRSSWHESQKFVIEIGGTRFFALKN